MQKTALDPNKIFQIANLIHTNSRAFTMQKTLPNRQQETFFKQRVLDYHAAWSPGDKQFDISQAEPFYSKRPDLSAYDIMPTQGPVIGWENYKAALSQIMAGFAKFTLFLSQDNVQVFLYGNIICTTSDFKIQGTLKNGQPIIATGRTSLVWEQQADGDWLIVHEHSSTPINN
jgi:ketosteroid isomerase-like protein